MMKKLSMILATILAIGIFFWGTAFAIEPQERPPQAPEACMAPKPQRIPHDPPMLSGMKLLLKCQETNVLAKLTGLSRENIRQLLISSPPPAILDAYGIPFDAFTTAMDTETRKLVKQSALVGIITKKQEEEILKRMTDKPALSTRHQKQG